MVNQWFMKEPSGQNEEGSISLQVLVNESIFKKNFLVKHNNNLSLSR
jgi:hypothetical protein